DALVVSSAVSLLTDPDQIVALAARHAVPAIYAWRASMAVGGLMSYATHWVPWTGHAFGLECMDSRLCSAAARTRLDRGSHPGDRGSLGGGKSRALRRDCR